MSVSDLAVEKSSVSEQEGSLFIDACRGIRTSRTPLWLMRQAGRYLPEYRELRKRHEMLQMFRTPDLAAEVTLQPIRRYGFDAAIIFADILTPLPEMGVTLDFIESKGPVITNGVSVAADVDRLRVPDEPAGSFTMSAMKIVCQELQQTKTPLIGFAGGPFTLSTYLMESGLSEKGPKTKKFMTREPEAWDRLQNKLVAMLVDYLCAQVEAGAVALQIFESWLGIVSPEQYQSFVEPYLKSLFDQLRKKVDVPLIFFSTGTTGLYPQFSKLSVDVFGVDWRSDLSFASELLGRTKPLQGNLDPYVLLAPDKVWKAEVSRILEQGKGLSGHIFNLGHGILPETSTEVVTELVEMVRSS